MSEDLRDVIAHQLAASYNRDGDSWNAEADAVLAARYPAACTTCGGSGYTYDLICDNCGGSASLPLGQTCPNHLAKPMPCTSCPTLATVIEVGTAWLTRPVEP